MTTKLITKAELLGNSTVADMSDEDIITRINSALVEAKQKRHPRAYVDLGLTLEQRGRDGGPITARALALLSDPETGYGGAEVDGRSGHIIVPL